MTRRPSHFTLQQSSRLATRVGDALYYSAKPPFGTLPDPTARSSQGSTSLTLANADGSPAGYALCDGYGDHPPS